MNERTDAVGNRARRRSRCLAIAICAVAAGTALSAPAAQGAHRILWSNFEADVVSFWNLDDRGGGGNINTGAATVDGPMGMALDPAHGRVYWANWGYDPVTGDAGDGTTIAYANLDGSGGGGTLPIAPGFVVGPHGLAIDPVAGKIYWPNYGDDTIAFANLDGGGAGRLNTEGATVNGPRGVTLDTAAGRIYWANHDSPGNPGLGTTISYANLDGSGGEDLMTTPATVEGPEGIALDTAAGRLYWGNYGPHPAQPGTGDTIAFANLPNGTGGGDLPTSPATHNHVHGVAIDPTAGEIYWANTGNHTLAVANLDGSGAATIPINGSIARLTTPAQPTLLDKPLGTASPSIGGEAVPGSTLGCGRGSWAPDLVSALLYRAPQSFTYQWTRDGQDVVGATSSSVAATELGTYRCRVTARNAAGATSQTSDPFIVAPVTPPSNSFKIGELKLNKHEGTAKLAVTVPGPGTLSLFLGKRLKAVSKTPDAGGVVRLAIQTRGKTSKALLHKGKVTLNPQITYTPTGGEANTKRESITLKEKLRG